MRVLNYSYNENQGLFDLELYELAETTGGYHWVFTMVDPSDTDLAHWRDFLDKLENRDNSSAIMKMHEVIEAVRKEQHRVKTWGVIVNDVI